MHHPVFRILIAALAVGCGGATELNGNGGTDGSGGNGGAGGTGGGISGPTTSGSTSAGTSVDGAATTTGTTSIGSSTASSTTGPDCVDLPCVGVMCSAQTDCPDGRTWTTPEGACCGGCMPDEPPACPEIACPPENTCPKGYVNGDAVGGCCIECLPDPLYCEVDEDCVVAEKPEACCGCPQVISKRALDDNACWSPLDDPRPIPDECYPDAICDLPCGPCPLPGTPACIDNRCTKERVEPL